MEMREILFVLAGILAGVLGGMGMGGGTILIPILTILFSISQHTSQAVNLIAFIPMAIVAIILHAKNKLIRKKGLLLIIIPATVISLVASLLSNRLQADFLKKAFGLFLVCLAVIQFFLGKVVKGQKRGEKTIKK